jgi:hypothetical protein
MGHKSLMSKVQSPKFGRWAVAGWTTEITERDTKGQKRTERDNIFSSFFLFQEAAKSGNDGQGNEKGRIRRGQVAGGQRSVGVLW